MPEVAIIGQYSVPELTGWWHPNPPASRSLPSTRPTMNTPQELEHAVLNAAVIIGSMWYVVTTRRIVQFYRRVTRR